MHHKTNRFDTEQLKQVFNNGKLQGTWSSEHS